ncbi:unnamed protein product [Hymenolepis diminuta]|uniref:RING-type domain-containing protein n=1 Tax=Hymenolepis diminuta TaxID=6216 RepID=A0A564Z2A7_HYMDI|nr:unnamed protein product [Hymenolepis diminuta]
MDSINCCICQEDFKEPIAKPDCCAHLFCLECLQPWLKEQNTCPYDRFSVHSIQIMNGYDGAIVETIPVPEASINVDVSDDNLDHDDSLFSQTPDEWIIRVSGIMEDFHDVFHQILNFNGSMFSFLEADEDMPEDLYYHNLALFAFRHHVDGIGEDPFLDSLSSEGRQMYEQLLINHERNVLHYFKECSKKLGVPLSYLESSSRPDNSTLLGMIDIISDCIWDFIVYFISVIEANTSVETNVNE